ncbi:insulinase family protein [bacterium]|nr:insulinase family protein [bacterium]
MRSRRFAPLWMGVLLLLGVAAAPAQKISDNLVVHQLDNGMMFLIYPREGAPVFSTVITFDVGGSDEQLGQTGIAHMFEHMAFKGTPKIGTNDYEAEKAIMAEMDVVEDEAQAELQKLEPNQERLDELRARLAELQEEQSQYIVKDEFDAIYTQAGGTGLNASTGWDATNYYISLPSNKLELWFWMESERAKHPVLREFYSERDVVVEERRMRTDNDPDGKMFEVFSSVLYDAHPYGQPIIGWPTDVRNLTTEMAREFRAERYGPKAAVAAIVGDVDPDEVIALAEKYFADWDAPGKPHRVPTKEPVKNGERRIELQSDAQPKMYIGWNKPGIPTREDAAFSLLDSIISYGRSSRLMKKLVLEDHMASEIYSFIGPGSKYDNAFIIGFSPLPPYTIFDVEQAVYEELDRIAEEGVTEREIEKVLNQYDAYNLRGLRSNNGLARRLASSYTLYKDPYAIEKELELLRSITPEEIQQVVKEYLTPERRVVVYRTGESETAEGQADGMEAMQ